jgi:hypothetical protein
MGHHLIGLDDLAESLGLGTGPDDPGVARNQD